MVTLEGWPPLWGRRASLSGQSSKDASIPAEAAASQRGSAIFLIRVKAFPAGNSPGTPRQDRTWLGQVEQGQEQDEVYGFMPSCRVCLLEVSLYELVIF